MTTKVGARKLATDLVLILEVLVADIPEPEQAPMGLKGGDMDGMY